jgi:4-amino-4-deoxy-L-arabinose transferase-like glycosyltransferase
MVHPLLTREKLTGDTALLSALAALSVALHLFSNLVFPYGIFRDEFYYIACSQNLDWGYVDHPPLIALITFIARALFGDSPAGLRFLPSLATGGVVLLTGLMARDLGGRRFGQFLAALLVLAAPAYWAVGGILSTVPFDHFFWALTAFFVLRLVRSENPKYWLAIGATVGLGLMTKNNMTFLAVALAVGVLFTPARTYLRTRGLWFGVLLALLIVLPNLIWELRNGFPTLEFIRNAASKNASQNPAEFLANQIFALNPFTLPFWIAGLVFYLRRARYRLLAFLYLVPLLILIASQAARPDYLTPAYAWLLAGGAVVFEQWTVPRVGIWSRSLAVGALVLTGVSLLPVGLPVLPVEQMAAYVRALGLANRQQEKNKTSLLPQYYADRFGWEEMAAALAQVYNALPVQERARATIFTANYGEAGSLNFYGARYNLPHAISGHNNYYLWGPGSATGEVVIVIGYGSSSDFASSFASVERVGTFTCDYCTSDENNLPIWVARGLKQPLPLVWPQVKHYG